MPLHEEDSPYNASYAYVGDDDSEYFRLVHARRLNVLNTVYLLPVDDDEVKRSELHHRMMQFVFGGRNYVGPVKEALQFGQQRRSNPTSSTAMLQLTQSGLPVLDLGTGGGFWAIAMADEFPRAEVIGIDLAPIQPRMVPSNCTFELCDLDQLPIPYPDNHFDFIHARYMHTGIRDYPRFLKEIARLLRPGGLVLIVEPNLHPTFLDTVAPVAPPFAMQRYGAGYPCVHSRLLSLSSPNLAAASSTFVDGASSSHSFALPSSASTPASRSPSPRPSLSFDANVRSADVDLPGSTFSKSTVTTNVSTPAVLPMPESSSVSRSNFSWTAASVSTSSVIPPTLASIMNPAPSPLSVVFPPPAPSSIFSPAPTPIPTPISTSTTSTSAPTPSPTPFTETASLQSNPLHSTNPSNRSPAPIDPQTSQIASNNFNHPQPGWTSFWETYRACLRQQNVDPTVPERLPALLSATGQFETIVDHEGNIPVGFWPKDDLLLTVGQLQWMDYELFIPALRPLFLSLDLPPSQVDRLIKNAQHDLYYPSTCQSTRLHIVYASKHMF